MQIVLRERERNGTLTTGLLLGLWIGEVLAAVEYWLLRCGGLASRVFDVLRRRPVLIAGAVVLGFFGGVQATLSRMQCDARVRFATLDVKSISTGAELYHVETGRWPSTLEQLVPRYLKELPRDPWGRNYAYYRGEGGIAVASAGPDRELGSGDDLIYVSPQR